MTQDFLTFADSGIGAFLEGQMATLFFGGGIFKLVDRAQNRHAQGWECLQLQFPARHPSKASSIFAPERLVPSGSRFIRLA